ncbi:MAG: 16S rRNA (cytidine(1402)-2'-O)-methyltransferase [Clostridia bacterium]|nr:16S rRNA (cytidine(1402)-2'-O)-methyltransferase [Clostridia bacterium]
MLYIVATPIGNLGDITLRALETLKSVDLIAAEDTRHTAKLLSFYDIKKPLVSYYEHNKMTRGPKLIEKLLAGENIALVSDAGTPGISDPGEDLVRLAIENGIEVTMLPGAVAGIMGLVLSGLPTGKFVFEGFLPEDKKKRAERMERIKYEERTLILYESPYNIIRTLKDIAEFSENRTVVLCREMTKKYEEFRRGTAAEHLEYFTENEPRGEFVVILQGSKDGFAGCFQNNAVTSAVDLSDQDIYKCVTEFMNNGMDKKKAIRSACEALKMARNAVYAAYENIHQSRD